MLSDSRFRVAVNPKAFFPVFLFASFFPAHSNAQNLLVDPRFSFASEDVQGGVRVGGEVVLGHHIPLDFFLEGEAALYLKTIKIQESANSYYQFRERRFCFGPGMTAGIPVSNAGFWTTGLGLGYSFAYYRGSNREPPSHWSPWVETGLRYIFTPHVTFGLNYRYQPDREASAHRISIEVGFRIFSERDAHD